MARFRRSAQQKLVPEFYLIAQPWPGCAVCRGVHPAARVPPPADLNVCPDCGADAAPPDPPVEAKSTLTGWSPLAIVARLLLWLGEALRNIAKGV